MDRDRYRVVVVDVVVETPLEKKTKKNIKTGQTTAIFFGVIFHLFLAIVFFLVLLGFSGNLIF